MNSSAKTSRLRGLLPVALGMVLGAGAMLVGLAQAGRLTASRPATVVALGQLVDAEHRRVDLMVDNGDIEGAIAALESLRENDWPDRETGGDLALELRHDIYGRLLHLRLEHPDVTPVSAAALLEIADEGLGPEYRDVDTNPFTARLAALRGQVLEQLERDDDALSAYEEALEMNSVLLSRELQGDEPQ